MTMAQRDASPSGYFLKRAEPSKGLALFPTLTGRERIIYKSRTCPNLPRWTDILVGSCSKSEKHCNYIYSARGPVLSEPPPFGGYAMCPEYKNFNPFFINKKGVTIANCLISFFYE
jgi:hypothetical protein